MRVTDMGRRGFVKIGREKACLTAHLRGRGWGKVRAACLMARLIFMRIVKKVHVLAKTVVLDK